MLSWMDQERPQIPVTHFNLFGRVGMRKLHSKRVQSEPGKKNSGVFDRLRLFLAQRGILESKCKYWHGTSRKCRAKRLRKCEPKCPPTCQTNALKSTRYCKSGHGGGVLCPVDCLTNALKQKGYCKSGHGGYKICPAFCPTNAFRSKAQCLSGHGGSALCQPPCVNAGALKRRCVSCNGSQLCNTCFKTVISKKGDVCRTCLPVPAQQARSREARMAASLNEWADQGHIPKYSLWNRRNPSADPVQCGGFRVDFVFELAESVLILEYDEGMHADRDRRCELVRQANCSLGYGGRPVHWIRFNPDAFKVAGVTRTTTRKEREIELLKQIQIGLANADYDHFITLVYLCYDKQQPSSGESDLIQKIRFQTIDAYCAWVDSVAPVEDSTGTSTGVGTGSLNV